MALLELPLDIPPDLADQTAEMSPRADPDKELLYLVHQFLIQENYEKTLHTLEIEKSLYFDLNYFEHTLQEGKWEDAEQYLLGFVGDANSTPTRWIIFEIRKHNYLEAINWLNKSEARNFLHVAFDNLVEPDMFNRLEALLELPNFRLHKELSDYGDVVSIRARLVTKIKNRGVITSHPVIKEKLILPKIKSKDLRTIYDEYKVTSADDRA